MTSVMFNESKEFKSQDIDGIVPKADYDIIKSLKMPDTIRLSTPKPVMHLGASTEVSSKFF